MTEKFGRLEQVDLRRAWETEAGDFTPWLAKEENISLLGDALGIELEVEAEEKSVGPFRADILCKIPGSDRYVLVENQLEQTDHGHLGQLLTYAAGLDAVMIVWVAKVIRDEHRAALDWLNEHTSEGISFFGIEVELYRIGDSPVAPRFNVKARPNQWTRSVAQTVRAKKHTDLTDRQKLMLAYWESLNSKIEASNLGIAARTTLPQGWFSWSIGKTDVVLFTTARVRLQKVGFELRLVGPYAKRRFDQLLEQREEIEKEAGMELDWLRKDDGIQSSIAVPSLSCNPADSADQDRQHKWIMCNLALFARVFRERVRELDDEGEAGA